MQKPDRINIRLTPEQRQIIFSAAQLKQQTVTSFLVESAFSAAQDYLANRQSFILSEKTFDELSAALEAPRKELSGLKRLLQTPSVLEKQQEREKKESVETVNRCLTGNVGYWNGSYIETASTSTTQTVSSVSAPALLRAV